MKFTLLIISIFILCSCENNSLNQEMNMDEVKTLIGTPDSIKQRKGLPDVYTNKIIAMETWYYGNDTNINFADNKIQTIQITK